MVRLIVVIKCWTMICSIILLLNDLLLNLDDGVVKLISIIIIFQCEIQRIHFNANPSDFHRMIKINRKLILLLFKELIEVNRVYFIQQVCFFFFNKLICIDILFFWHLSCKPTQFYSNWHFSIIKCDTSFFTAKMIYCVGVNLMATVNHFHISSLAEEKKSIYFFIFGFFFVVL